jgi:hypothetical protein
MVCFGELAHDADGSGLGQVEYYRFLCVAESGAYALPLRSLAALMPQIVSISKLGVIYESK